MSQMIRQKMTFDKSGYFFIGLLILVVLGFWPSYFSKFFDGTADFNFYFHFHAIIAGLWLLMVIVQPILIHKKKLILHKRVGKLSFIIVPLIFISVMLLAHSRITATEAPLGISLWIPFKDLFILGIAYFIAMRHRKTMAIHARAMIVCGIVMIEPALVRFMLNTFFPGQGFAPAGYLLTIGLVYLLLIGLIVAERKQAKGRWVFPLVMGLYLFVHSVIIFQIKLPPWEAFARWFASLPLT